MTNSQEPTGLTVAELPMAWFHRGLIEDSADQMRQTLAAAVRTVRGETANELKDGVDPVELLVEQAKLLGQTELLLRMDDEALERRKQLDKTGGEVP